MLQPLKAAGGSSAELCCLDNCDAPLCVVLQYTLNSKKLRGKLNEKSVGCVLVDLMLNRMDGSVHSERTEGHLRELPVLRPERNPDDREVAEQTECEMHNSDWDTERQPEQVA